MPSGDPNDKKKDDQNPPDDQAKGLGEEDVGRIVNAAVTSQLKRALPAALGEAMKGLNLGELVAAEVKKLSPADPGKAKSGGDGDEDGAGKGGAVTKAELQKQLQSIQEKLETEQKARQAADQARTEVENQRKFDAARSQFRAAVQPKVRPELLEDFVDLYAVTRGRLKVGEDGKPLLTVKRAAFKGAPELPEDLPLDEAVPIFLTTNEVRPFLPAPGGQQGRDGQQQRNGLPPFIAAGGKTEEAQLAAVDAAFQKAGLPPDVL